MMSLSHTLAEEAHVEVDDDLTRAGACRMIDELREQTGRGVDCGRPGWPTFDKEARYQRFRPEPLITEILIKGSLEGERPRRLPSPGS